MRGAPGASHLPSIQGAGHLPSIQTVYNLYWDERKTGANPVLRCKSEIKIPVYEPVPRTVNNNAFMLAPAIAIVIDNDYPDAGLPHLKIIIETNEGAIVQPKHIKPPFTPYKEEYLLFLPRGTTGVKKVRIAFKENDEAVTNDLVFGVMPSPYNYENALFSTLFHWLNNLERNINMLSTRVVGLESRVTALEQRAGT